MRTLALALVLGVASALTVRETKETPDAAATAAEPAFYMTAMAKLASKHQTRLWLSSIRLVGKWKGDIVIVTDKPECLAQNLGTELLGVKETSSNDGVDMYSMGSSKTYMVKQPTTTNIREMKAQKAKAWINVHNAGLAPSFVVHTDQDIVFGQDVNIFLTHVKTEVEPQKPVLALFTDQGVTKGQLHTGIVVMFPGEKTDACLASWGAKILTVSSSHYSGFAKEVTDFDREEAESAGPDQRALAKTQQCTSDSGIIRMPPHFLMMPKGGSLANNQTATFIHFTNTNRWKSIKDATMQKYFTEVLNLPKQEWFGYENCTA